MNLEQLQSMSDSELNELSAVKVMGWEKKGTSTAYFLNGEIIRTMEETSYGSAWNPTTDMNDAMELYRELKKDDWRMHLMSHYSHGPERPFEFGCDLARKGIHVVGYSETAPRAITIAALLALE